MPMEADEETHEDDPRVYTLPASFRQDLEFRNAHRGASETNLVHAWRLKGRLDIDVLQRALNLIAARHETFRTHLAIADGDHVVQVIRGALEMSVALIDLSCVPSSKRYRALSKEITRLGQRPIPLDRSPLARTALAKIGAQDHVFVLVVAHTIWDASSSVNFTAELSATYHALAEGGLPPMPELSIQFGDVAAWERTPPDSDQRQYWVERLAGYSPRLHDSVGRQRQDVTWHAPAEQPLPPVGRRCMRALRLSAREAGATVPMALATLILGVISLRSEQRDAVLALVDANRDSPETRPLIGLMASLLLVRVTLSPGLTYLDLLQRVRDAVTGAYGHKIPLEYQLAAGGQSSPARSNKLIADAFVNVCLPTGASETRRPASLVMERFSPPRTWYMAPAERRWRAHALDVRFSFDHDKLEGMIVYNCHQFDRDFMRELTSDLARLTRFASLYPHRPIDDLLALTPTAHAPELPTM